MKILYYDCFAGISGDMNLAALLDLGLDEALLRGELSKLRLGHEFELQVSRGTRRGISGTRVDVRLADEAVRESHRGLTEIEAMLDGSPLDPAVRKTALEILGRVAKAEARIHDKDVREVHFHEVGATDSIVDVVGAAVAFHGLEVDQIWSSAVELGGGFVRCAHGTLPVPAPATAEILTGIPTTRGATDQEMTTPTGAAILASLVDRFDPRPALTVTATGYGLGHRDMEIPNLLRVHRAEVPQPGVVGREDACLLQCNIDDMTGEALGAAMDALMAAGASDVHFTPIIMKKSRPATQVSLLCPSRDRSRFEVLLFRHTTTLGIKGIPVDKTILETRIEPMETPLGTVRFKRALLGGVVIRSKPELEDCRALAERHGLSLLEVQKQIREGTEKEA